MRHTSRAVCGAPDPAYATGPSRHLAMDLLRGSWTAALRLGLPRSSPLAPSQAELTEMQATSTPRREMQGDATFDTVHRADNSNALGVEDKESPTDVSMLRIEKDGSHGSLEVVSVEDVQRMWEWEQSNPVNDARMSTPSLAFKTLSRQSVPLVCEEQDMERNNDLVRQCPTFSVAPRARAQRNAPSNGKQSPISILDAENPSPGFAGHHHGAFSPLPSTVSEPVHPMKEPYQQRHITLPELNAETALCKKSNQNLREAEESLKRLQSLQEVP